jgi:hypothetical protein
MERWSEAVDPDSPDRICMRDEEDRHYRRMTAEVMLRKVECDFEKKWPRKYLTYLAWKKNPGQSKNKLARRLKISHMTVWRHIRDFNDYAHSRSINRRKTA